MLRRLLARVRQGASALYACLGPVWTLGVLAWLVAGAIVMARLFGWPATLLLTVPLCLLALAVLDTPDREDEPHEFGAQYDALMHERDRLDAVRAKARAAERLTAARDEMIRYRRRLGSVLGGNREGTEL